MDWANEKAFWWLLVIPVFLWTASYILKWRRKKRALFADQKFWSDLMPKSSSRGFKIKAALLLFALLAIIITLADPLFGNTETTVKRQGLDVVVALDLSESMNADDVPPSRLKKSKKIIQELLNLLGGDRVGLIIFAGDAFVAAPLTSDYNALSTYLNALSTDLVTNQGTDFSAALSEGVKLMDSNSNLSAVVLISDGEDHEQNFEITTNQLNKKGIKVLTVGVGTTKGSTFQTKEQGGYQKKRDEFGSLVVSKLQENSLREIASETSGQYLKADGTSETIAQNIFSFLNQMERESLEEKNIQTKKHVFQWFLAVALVLLLIDFLTTEGALFNRQSL